MRTEEMDKYISCEPYQKVCDKCKNFTETFFYNNQCLCATCLCEICGDQVEQEGKDGKICNA